MNYYYLESVGYVWLNEMQVREYMMLFEDSGYPWERLQYWAYMINFDDMDLADGAAVRIAGSADIIGE